MQSPDHNDEGDGWDTEGGDDTPADAGHQLPSTAEPAPLAEAGAGELRVIRIWNPKPVGRPAVDPDLTLMRWPERSAEVIRYTTLAAEHWLSRGGVLREWLRLSLWSGILLLVAGLVVVPPVTMLLSGVSDWTALTRRTAENIRSTLNTLPPLVVAIGVFALCYKLMQGRWRNRRRRPYRGGDQYEM